jgi:RNA recognition motif-containing protein
LGLAVSSLLGLFLEDPVKKLFVGNLPFTTNEDEVRAMFAEFGDVQGVTIPTDRDTGKPRGFAFVEMAQDDDAEKAIAAVNGKRVGGRALNVNEARPKEGGGGGGGHRGGGGGRERGGGGGGGYRY